MDLYEAMKVRQSVGRSPTFFLSDLASYRFTSERILAMHVSIPTDATTAAAAIAAESVAAAATEEAAEATA